MGSFVEGAAGRQRQPGEASATIFIQYKKHLETHKRHNKIFDPNCNLCQMYRKETGHPIEIDSRPENP